MKPFVTKLSVQKLNFGHWVSLIVLPAETDNPLEESEKLLGYIKSGYTTILKNEHTVVSIDNEPATYRVQLMRVQAE
jgi:hypothetical protein